MKSTLPPVVADLASPRRSAPMFDTPQPADVVREIGVVLAAHLAVAAAIVLVVGTLAPRFDPSSPTRLIMLDILALAAGCALFLLAIGYAHACDRL